MQSLAVQLASLPATERQALLRELSEEEFSALEYDWHFWARPEQQWPSGRWRVWLVKAGRGWGKTRVGAEFICEKAREGQVRIALIGETSADTRDVLIEGESGILACSPPWFRPVYEPSKRRVTWPNGAIATTYSGDTPDQLRGPQHHYAWADECAKWKYADEAWDMMEFGLRLGSEPQVVATTTPRPIPLIRELMQASREPNSDVMVTHGDTYDNLPNLAEGFIRRVIRKYEGTRLGRQELHAEILDDTPGALWTRAILEASRVSVVPEIRRIVVGVDPAAGTVTETGIVGAGLGVDGHGYVLDDVSMAGLPDGWASQVIAVHRKLKGDRIIAESNNGGEMVRFTLRTVDRNAPITLIHASRGKQARAEPVAALYEQGRIHHVGMFAGLEDEFCSWVPGEGHPSPNRLDACVWALTELMLQRTHRFAPVGD